MNEIVFKRTSTKKDLEQILRLQQSNLPETLANKERTDEGFVTVHHNFKTIKAMNDSCPHVIAVHNSKVVGYALCMLESFADDIDILRPMFDQINKCLENPPNYLVMG